MTRQKLLPLNTHGADIAPEHQLFYPTNPLLLQFLPREALPKDLGFVASSSVWVEVATTTEVGAGNLTSLGALIQS